MKYLFVSDIHGSLPALEQVLAYYRREQCDMLCLLGDILNYGPRNRIPEGLDPKAVADRLNQLREHIVAVRGNCDSEVDQMLLHFPMMADYALLVDGGKRFFLTHGHLYSEKHLPPCRPDVLVCGHTHRWKLEQDYDGLTVCNLGSVTFPKGGNVPTFAVLSDGRLSMHRLDGEEVAAVTL